jgi:putative CocE/NonD family hydrolase
MRVRGLAIAAAMVATMVGPPTVAQAEAPEVTAHGWTAYDRPAENGVVTERDVPITMRDGTVLMANVQRPDAPGRHPVLVTQTAYNKDGVLSLAGDSSNYFVERGYALVTVDVRGTGSSQGVWDSFGEPEQRDGYDTVEWAARQPWSSGDVGLTGGSYLAITQITTAAQQPPHLRAMFPVVPMADGYRDITYSGGDVNVSFIPLWLGLVTAGSVTPAQAMLDGSLQNVTRGLTALSSHVGGVISFQIPLLLRSIAGDDEIAYDGAFWGTRSPIELADRIEVPTFVVGGLHDIFQRGEPLLYERLKNRVPTRLLIGPWTHLTTGGGLPQGGVPTVDQIQLRWFDQWLKGIDTDIEKIPAVTQYTYGTERWETNQDWPHPKLDPQRWYLRGGKGLSTQEPAAGEAPQTFVQHPLSGICTMSTGQWTAGAASGIPCEQDERPNELSGGATYTSAPLDRDLHLNGPINARLWLTTTAADAAVTVRVADVQPGGEVRAITTGWQTASLRASDGSRARVVRGHLLQPWHPFTKASRLAVKAGEPTAVDVEVFPTNLVLQKGHRLKITIDPADFPHQLPPLPAALERLGGQVAVLSDPAHPSAIELPVIGDTCAVPAEKAKPKKPKAKKKNARKKRTAKKRKARTAGATAAPCRSLPVPDMTRPG